MEETPVEAEPEGDFQSVSQKMRDISQQFDLNSSQGTQTSISVQQNICAYVRYLDWLENLKQVQSGLIQSSKESTTSESDSNDIENITTRIAALQEEFIKEKSSNAIQELIIRRSNSTNTHTHTFIMEETPVEAEPEGDFQSQSEDERYFTAFDLNSSQGTQTSISVQQNELLYLLYLDWLENLKQVQSGLIQSSKESTTSESDSNDIEDVNTRIFCTFIDVQAANVDLMKKLQSKESADRQVAEPSNSVRQEQEKLDDLISHVAMEKGILQGLIIGSGVNWAKDPDLKDIVIGLGQQLKLD
nr:centromere protein H-like [Lytechinus pictus]